MRKRVLENKKNKSACPKLLHRCSRGYMLIEAVIATFIVGIVLVTFLTVMAASYRTEFSKRDIIIASNLAQEGIEIVRNIRDNNWKTCVVGNTPPCNDGFKSPPFPAPASVNLCNIAYNYNYSGATMPAAGCAETVLRKSGDFYTTGGGGTVTKFYRTVSISGAGESRTITSRIRWGTTSDKILTMTDTIYSWGNTE